MPPQVLQVSDQDKSELARPTFPAFVIKPETAAPVHLVAWCPWCEELHWHGAAGGGGHRAPHCAGDWHSPLGGIGYDLDVVGEAASEKAALPGGVMVGEQRLHRVIDQAAGVLRAGLLRYVLGIKTVRGPVLQKRTPRGTVWIFGADGWLIEPRGRKTIEGRGFVQLAAHLYGVPPGVAAVRFLEAVSFDRLDAEAALAVQSAIDAWVARGAPARVSR